VNAFTLAAVALLAGWLPLAYVILRHRPIDGLVALEVAGTVAVLVLLCLAEGFHRSFEYGVAVVAAVLSWLSGMTFARFLGRWL
jgi:multisubunit Na+/H+ antiporter MnhF subunit